MDNSVLLTDYRYFENSVLRQQWVSFSEYGRKARPKNPLSHLWGYTHYLRFRWKLDGRREILPMALRSLRRRLSALPGDAQGENHVG